jgi:acetyl-CoA carboxylase carboxyl transferase subunit alpha
MSVYLDFEEPIKALEEQIEQTKEIGASTEVDKTDKIAELQEH